MRTSWLSEKLQVRNVRRLEGTMWYRVRIWDRHHCNYGTLIYTQIDIKRNKCSSVCLQELENNTLSWLHLLSRPLSTWEQSSSEHRQPVRTWLLNTILQGKEPKPLKRVIPGLEQGKTQEMSLEHLKCQKWKCSKKINMSNGPRN